MSFDLAYTDVLICNLALAELAQAPISSLNDTGLAARECRRFYKPTVALLLTKHHWNLYRKREVLAFAPENTRPLEWTYAYQAPTGTAHLILTPSAEPVAASSYAQASGVSAQRNMLSSMRAVPFARAGGVVYTNLPNAAAEFTSTDTNEASFTPELVDVISAHLQAKLVMPILKNPKLAEAKASAANALLNQALSAELNEGGDYYGDFISDDEMARAGLMIGI